jgi:hypothetical protein
MRWSLVAPGGLARLAEVVAVMIGLGVAGDQVAGWVRERRLPSSPMKRHLITCPRCAGDAPLFPLDEHGQPRSICPEMSRLNRSVLIRGIARGMFAGCTTTARIRPGVSATSCTVAPPGLRNSRTERVASNNSP